MINIQLTNKEWYFLYIQITKLIKENTSDHIAARILDKLAENCPKIDDIKTEFKQEYKCEWVEDDNEK